MKESGKEILDFKALEIGYSSAQNRKSLLPPLNASAHRGELIAVLGRNGIGKSTLLRTLSGLTHALSGTINISGKNIASYSRLDLAQRIGYISTDNVRINNMTVYDLVSLGRFPHSNWIGSIDLKSKETIHNAISNAGISGLEHRYISELSDGERQRAMIARVLAQDTELMIMDEPTAFLDVSGRYDIMHLLMILTRTGKTIIFSTHDYNIAVNQADKIWLLLDRELAEGSPEDLILSGNFGKLFKSQFIDFNINDGNLNFHFEHKGRICIKSDGESLLQNWTERAVERAGFELSDSVNDTCIKVFNESGKFRWQVIQRDTGTDFHSIYDLVTFLKTIGN